MMFCFAPDFFRIYLKMILDFNINDHISWLPHNRMAIYFNLVLWCFWFCLEQQQFTRRLVPIPLSNPSEGRIIRTYKCTVFWRLLIKKEEFNLPAIVLNMVSCCSLMSLNLFMICAQTGCSFCMAKLILLKAMISVS